MDQCTSALTELAPSLSPANGNLARDGLSDPDPMVRIGALDMLENAPANQIWPLVSPLLSDPVRGVRFIFIVWLAAYANAAQERGDPKTIFKDPMPKFRPDLCCRL